MDLLSFLNKPIKITGVLRGFHAILTPDNSRVIALILSRGFKTLTLYIRQVDGDNIEIEVSDENF